MVAWEEGPRQFKMSKQLDEGKFGEDLARKFLNDPIIKVNHGISHYDDVTQDRTYQDKDTDFIFGRKTAKPLVWKQKWTAIIRETSTWKPQWTTSPWCRTL